jgi:hypothetical protein
MPQRFRATVGNHVRPKDEILSDWQITQASLSTTLDRIGLNLLWGWSPPLSSVQKNF